MPAQPLGWYSCRLHEVSRRQGPLMRRCCTEDPLWSCSKSEAFTGFLLLSSNSRATTAPFAKAGCLARERLRCRCAGGEEDEGCRAAATNTTKKNQKRVCFLQLGAERAACYCRLRPSTRFEPGSGTGTTVGVPFFADCLVLVVNCCLVSPPPPPLLEANSLSLEARGHTL